MQAPSTFGSMTAISQLSLAFASLLIWLTHRSRTCLLRRASGVFSHCALVAFSSSTIRWSSLVARSSLL
uniref:Putative secreted peptide n=1 Tax=Anopheles braziliensis TaxID=58242 RepID=A0A2M3ZWD0_9DIPT